MLDNILIISPIFVIMIIGFVMGRSSIFPEGSGAARSLTSFVWYVAIPALIFKLLATNSFPSIEEIQIVLGYYIVLYAIYFISAFIVAPQLKIDKKGRGIFAMSCCFGNLGFVGIPVIEGAFGEEGLGILLIIISFHMLTLLPITTLITEMSDFNTEPPWKILRQAIIKSIKNPVVISLIVGLSWSAFGIDISEAVIRLIDFPASAAAPVGLFAVGLSLSRVKIKGELTAAVIPVIIKMAILPIAVYFMMTQILQVSTIWANTATLTACLPTGMAPYAIAEQYDRDIKRTSSTILISVVVSVFSLIFAVSILI